MNNKKIRFGTIHGMRGIAAMGVVLYHLAGNLESELKELLPNFVTTIFSYGYLGVPIFFVISGFVISYGIASDKINSKYVGNFILRRSIRLDITYWASIALALILLAIKNKFLGTSESLPSITVILLNMFYIQELLEAKPTISVVYWTLCLEVQFYLFYIFSMWFSQRVTSSKHFWLNSAIILSLGVYSIALDLELIKISINGLFVSNWHYFLMGILVCNIVRNTPSSHYIFVLWILIEIVFQTLFKFKEYTAAGIFCSVFLFGMWKYKGLNILFKGKILKYLGTISYPLYLVHPDIGWKTISFGKHVLGSSITPWQSGLLLVVGIITSIAVAHIFHMIFEKPTQKIASRVKTEPLLNVLKNTFPVNRTSRT